jgi:ABC-type multidrug transport system permease subunit
MSRAEYLASHVLSRFLFLVLETVVIVGFAWAAFGVTVRGSLAAVGVIAVLGALSFGGLGLLVASRARTVEAVSGLMNLVMMPMWVLSGVFFASGNFPDFMQPIIQALPLTALTDALRGVMNEGRSLTALGDEVAILAAWGALPFALALRLFRWQ